MTPADAPAPASRTAGRRIEHVDTDASGVVHFSRYVSLMETFVLDYLEEHGAGLTRLADLGADLAVTDLSVRYSRPSVYRDAVVGEVVVEHVGAARIKVAARLLREEADGSHAELAAGTLTFAAVRPTNGGAVPLPLVIRHALKGIVPDAARHDSAAGPTNGTGRSPVAGAAAGRRPVAGAAAGPTNGVDRSPVAGAAVGRRPAGR
ncbi:acyl-CoA thioesterase [Streptomyces sp. NPDC087658]|uniref:acyl-CoA thioesterase n=1 Tax=Streptomyces sp. NPDC087658 TaxID=3365800 RepID=UPI00381E829B